MVHANHPRELTAAAKAAVTRLIRAGIPVLSQTVLLRGVNDDAVVLEALFRGLVAMRVKPVLPAPCRPRARHRAFPHRDRVEGSSWCARCAAALPGLCQPTYVLDIPGGYGKVPIGPCAIRASDGCGWTVEDSAGVAHPYPPDPDEPLESER